MLARTRLALLILLVAACGDGQHLRIGTKPFAEQEILAEIITAVLDDAEIRTHPPLRCADTYECHRALREGDIDLMVEYTGTALHFVGEPPPSKSVDPLPRLQELYAPMGVRWVAPLGFDNGYVWLVPSGVGGDKTMSELAKRGSPIRIASPPEYLRRPRDGLMATADRYGVRIAEPPLVITDPLERYHAVTTGRADVAIGYRTDGDPLELGLRPLRDDLEFFGPYRAAIVAREDALQATKGLAATLGRLEGRIDGDTMRDLNREVALHGQAIDAVAARFVYAEGLVEERRLPGRASEVTVAYGSELVGQSVGARTLSALRTTFPEQPVRLRDTADPLADLLGGRARFAIVTADAFFRTRRGRLKRRSDAAALAVLGHLTVHVLTRPESAAEPLGGRVGVDARTPAIGDAVTAGLGLQPARRDELPALLSALTEGSIDVAIVPAFAGDDAIQAPLADGSVRLAPVVDLLDAEQLLRAPWLRRARIPADTYPGQPDPVETISTQVLLAGPVHRFPHHQAVGGPAAAVALSGPTLTAAQLETLVDAVGIPETPDPALPSQAIRREAADASGSWLDGLLNAVVIAFLAWLFLMVAAPLDRRAQP